MAVESLANTAASLGKSSRWELLSRCFISRLTLRVKQVELPAYGRYSIIVC